MIEQTQYQNTVIKAEKPDGQNRKAFRMREDDRMAGSVPVWNAHKTARENIAGQIAMAKAEPHKSFDAALAYTDQNRATAPSEEFGFGDIVDMVNPLQHIPIIGHLYREFTGDDIKPISRLIGSAAYGGPLGAAGTMADIVVEQETGKDFTGNVMALATQRKPPERTEAAMMAFADLQSYEARHTHPYQYNG